jgi:putative ABC transport system permease protein
MIRGRLTAVNGHSVDELHFEDERAENLATREQNLTWATELGSDNRIVAGTWFTAADQGKPLVSISTELEESLRVHVGDHLVFDVAGEAFDVQVASVRNT